MKLPLTAIGATSAGPAQPIARTLRALARLLDYPDGAVRAHLGELSAALREERALGPLRLAELDALLSAIGRQDPLDAEADYVQLFDSGRRTALFLFEHVHGDSRDRGPAMIDLARSYEQAGLYLSPGAMPDHLPVVLEYASTQPPREARAFIGEFAHLLNAIFQALHERGSRYASAIGALLDLAGEPRRPVVLADEEPLDSSWAEPAAFDGCTSSGQSAPPVQTVRFVRASARAPRPPSPGVQP